MKKLSSLSVFFPAYNDAQSLPYLLEDIYSVLKNITSDFEVIIINDASKDNTKKVVKGLQKKYKNLLLINHIKNRGYGGALQSGFKNASKDWIFYTDGDGQYNPQQIKELLKHLKKNINVVNGFKLQRTDPFSRIWLGKIYNSLVHMLYPISIKDIDCDFRLINSDLLKDIRLSSTSGLICLELILKLSKNGAHFAEVGVDHKERKYGSSQFFTVKNLYHSLKEHCLFYIKTRGGRALENI